MSLYTELQAHRAKPSSEWIEEVRKKYPTETAIDEVFTRKLHKRGHALEHSMNFSKLLDPLTRFIKKQTGEDDIAIENLQRLSGGASKEQFTFELTLPNPGVASRKRKLMIRMDPQESIVETHRLREYQLLSAAYGEVPVPEMLWIDANGEDLGQPALIAEFLEGTVQPDTGSEKFSGVGMYFPPAHRQALKDQFVEILARIHRIDWRNKELSSFEVPRENSTEAVEKALGLWERAWNEDTLSAHPIMERAALWLRENMPIVESPILVHGDYRSGNFMFDKNMNINAIFDWELAYLGDFHDDLAWASLPLFAGPDEDGNYLASGLLETEAFLALYQDLSGNKVDPKKLFFYQVFSFYKISVIAAATGVRIAHGRKTHLDAMMNLASGLGCVGFSELNRLLDTAE